MRDTLRKYTECLKYSCGLYVGNLKILIIFTIFLLLAVSDSFGQQAYRRHYIIAYDISTPFINKVNNCPAYKQALKNLFSNRSVYRYNEAHNVSLNDENGNGVPFFDPKRDEISFFHFNVSENEMIILRQSVAGKNENEVVSAFNSYFVKDKNLNWTSFSAQRKVTPSDYITVAFSIQPTSSDFANGVSMSNLVYPLVLNKIETKNYAEEYILILLSDFMTGAMLGNTKDLDRVRDIYRVPYGIGLTSHSPVNSIQKQIDYLASKYYKVDYFQYSFIPDNTRTPIGIIAYKIKPKVGLRTLEDVSVFVDGDLSLEQKGYNSDLFKTSETKIKFTHNEKLEPVELRLTIVMPSSNGESVLFDDVVATLDKAGKWISKYTDDDDLMRFDKSNLTYIIPSLKISIKTIINERNFKNLKFIYQFGTRYNIANTNSLKFIFKTDRELSVDHIKYSSKATIIIMTIVLPFILMFGLVIFLIYYGKPRKISLQIEGYSDSYEKTDYSVAGKQLTPYKAWNTEQPGKSDYLVVKGIIEYMSPDFIFNWKSPVKLRVVVDTIPKGFEMFILNDGKEFAAGADAYISKDEKNQLEFILGIRQNIISKVIEEPELVKFKVETGISDSVLFIKSELEGEPLEYMFLIGADLGYVWVGLDPGTSGSCAAVGSATENIIIIEDEKKNKIIPSVLAFDKKYKYRQDGIYVPGKAYKYGAIAVGHLKNKIDWRCFQSIKKLIGFNDIKEITFNNCPKKIQIKGKDLATLLVKGLYKDIDIYFKRSGFNADEYKRDGIFNPMRAVVAIPNNFTAMKIQDMIECIEQLKQFKEIRCVYEAEAVLFYYMSNYRKFNNGKVFPNSETILVFDMGGATINATLVKVCNIVKETQNKYEIDVLGKIGYGIGGDTIDYYIFRFILSFTKEVHEFSTIDIGKKKVELATLAFKIKNEIVVNYLSGKPYLITAFNLQLFINDELGLSIYIDEYTSDMYSYFKKTLNKFKLFEHPLFVNNIYNNVKEAVNEVIALSGGVSIDKVVYAGRSTAFPMIKETVEKQLDERNGNSISIPLSMEESKIAVAQGACWYGINKNLVILNKNKTNASFGIKKTMSADKADVKYIEFIKMGLPYEKEENKTRFCEISEKYEDLFDSDSNKVNFYQVMGKDADRILAEGQKHKFSKIVSISVNKKTSEIGMRVSENDKVDCIVLLNTGQIIKESGVVADQQIDDANEEHYTWLLKL